MVVPAPPPISADTQVLKERFFWIPVYCELQLAIVAFNSACHERQTVFRSSECQRFFTVQATRSTKKLRRQDSVKRSYGRHAGCHARVNVSPVPHTPPPQAFPKRSPDSSAAISLHSTIFKNWLKTSCAFSSVAAWTAAGADMRARASAHCCLTQLAHRSHRPHFPSRRQGCQTRR